MNKLVLASLVVCCTFISLAACGEVVVGYSPPIPVPIRVSINSRGEINLDVSGRYATPIGVFDIGYGGSVYSLRKDYSNRLLIVHMDNKANVYELVEGQEFKVNFDDSNTLYKKVALTYETDGDIVLQLESVKVSVADAKPGGNSPPAKSPINTPVPPTTSNTTSCPGAPAQRVVVGEKAYVCTKVDRLIVREKPAKSASEITRIKPGTVMTIVKGPVCADNWSWWRIKTTDGVVVGWVSEGGDNTDRYFICPK